MDEPGSGTYYMSGKGLILFCGITTRLEKSWRDVEAE